MANFDAARRIQSKIRAYLGASASALQAVPEIESGSTQDAIRKLQLQVFELADALAATGEELQRLQLRTPQQQREDDFLAGGGR